MGQFLYWDCCPSVNHSAVCLLHHLPRSWRGQKEQATKGHKMSACRNHLWPWKRKKVKPLALNKNTTSQRQDTERQTTVCTLNVFILSGRKQNHDWKMIWDCCRRQGERLNWRRCPLKQYGNNKVGWWWCNEVSLFISIVCVYGNRVELGSLVAWDSGPPEPPGSHVTSHWSWHPLSGLDQR